MKLVCMMGVKSSPHLVEAFLDHYYRLGIDTFLIILHSEPGDPRAGSYSNALKRYHIAPVSRASEFSAVVKRAYFLDAIARHCAVTTGSSTRTRRAPGVPVPTSRRCSGSATAGLCLRGGTIRRSTRRRRTVIRDPPRSPDLGAVSVHRAGHGTHRTRLDGQGVCRQGTFASGRRCARSSVGPDPVRNYVRTSRRDREGSPDRHRRSSFQVGRNAHRRTEEKVDAAGGDRDVIDEASFMHEYRSILEHVRARDG